MTKSTILRGILIAASVAALSGCIVDPRLNAGLSIGQDGVSMTPSVQAEVGGGLLQYTPRLR